VNTVMNLWIVEHIGKCLSSWRTGGLSSRSRLTGVSRTSIISGLFRVLKPKIAEVDIGLSCMDKSMGSFCISNRVTDLQHGGRAGNSEWPPLRSCGHSS
jgi:hypothetical protein